MRYAMIEQNTRRVVEIVKSESVPYFPPTQEGTEIEAIECLEAIERGWYYVDGTFTTENPYPPGVKSETEPEPMSIYEEATLATSVTTEYIACMMEINS